MPQVDQVKYLGLTIDSGLSWGPHIDALCDRLAAACFALSRLRPSLHTDNVKKAYFGYFHSILSYGVELWGDAADRERVFWLQKRAIRVVAGVRWDHPAKELFIGYKILTLPSLYILEVAKQVRYNLEQFQSNAHEPKYHLRRGQELRAPRTRLAKAKKCLNYIGPKIYNQVPDDIKVKAITCL